MKRKYAALILAGMAIISGCAQYQAFQVGKMVVKEGAADAADNIVRYHKWALCEAIPIGAARRAFGKNPAPYRALCSESDIGLIGDLEK